MGVLIAFKFLRWTLAFSIGLELKKEPRSEKEALIEALLNAAANRPVQQAATGDNSLD